MPSEQERTLKRTFWLLVMVVGSMALSTGALKLWLNATEPRDVAERVPTAYAYDWPEALTRPARLVNTGTLLSGKGVPSTDAGSWLQFRGADRTNIADAREKLLRTWPPDGPEVLWRIPVGDGHAGPVVHKGRVFLMDYDEHKKEDAVRCLSLADGAEIWRYTYSVVVKPQHGMSRTVPAVTDDYVVTLGPKGHVHCLEMETGKLVWKMDLVKEYGTRIPSWYAGQCPLIDGDVVILAPGAEPLMMAVQLASGNILWKTPNPDGWGMTHSSVTSMDFAGGRHYIYCTTKGVAGIDARDGKLLWTHPWTIGYAVVPMPVVIAPDRVFLSGGYRAESVMLRLSGSGQSVSADEVLRLPPETFGSDQQTPILHDGHLYAVIPRGRGQLACMDVDGKLKWVSGFEKQFHLGPYILADGLLLVLSSHHDSEGVLHLVEASPDAAGYKELAQAKVVNGHDCWGPMALVNGKLLLRDSDELVCLTVGRREP